jgi:hypothetical protein
MTPEVARDAYVWGYPLVVMHRTRALHCARTPPGRLHHVERLATPASRTVVAPNNDTLYSSGWYDLAAGDVEVAVPPIDRYWSVMVLDAYTHVSYVSRRTHGRDGARVRLGLDASAPDLRVPTATVWVLVRTIVDGPDDLDAARAAQRSIEVTAPPGHPEDLTTPIGRPNEVHTAGAAFFDELAAALAVDPPGAGHPPAPDGVLELVEGPAAGRAALDPDVLVEGVRLGEAVVARGPLATHRTNGWGTNPTGSDFGDDVARRATTAKYALAAHHPVENRSYIAGVDADGGHLDGDRPLSLTFAPGDPPCDGFWSLTVYGPDGFLVANELDRYALGDRTPGLRRAADGSLALTVGGPRPDDPSNWLPAPPGRYGLALRVYEGRPEVVDLRWFPPALEPA